jgi:hypothetical protein
MFINGNNKLLSFSLPDIYTQKTRQFQTTKKYFFMLHVTDHFSLTKKQNCNKWQQHDKDT